MEEYVGKEYLKTRLSAKKHRVLERYKYYDQKYMVKDFRISTPPKLVAYQTVLGWCTKAVDSIADRLVVSGIENDDVGMMEVFNLNNADVLFDSAILSALISSCSFIYIHLDEEGFPKLEVIDGANATGIIDVRTSMLKEGYAVLERDKMGIPTIEAYFTPEYTEFFEKGKTPYRVENPTRYPLIVPIIFKPSDKRPFGHSRISRSCIDLVQGACRTIKRAEITAEFYSYPQKYVLGVSESSEDIDKWKANMSSLMIWTKDEDGDKPTVGQFSQQSMSPHIEQMKDYVLKFCGETGLHPNDLGYVTENPSSAEAIKSGHESLRLITRKAQRNFGVGFLNAGYLAVSLRDNVPYQRTLMKNMKVTYEPIFEPDASMLSNIGDGAIKINQAIPGYFGTDNLFRLTGIKADEQ